MPAPRLNRILFTVYAILAAIIFIAGLVAPGLRTNRWLAGAPLRDFFFDNLLARLLPAPDPIVVSVLYSTEKEAWLTEAIQDFEAGQPRLDGRPIEIELEKMGSREIYLSILDGTRQPDIISPASSLQIAILQELSVSQFGAPVVNLADKANCRPVATTPLVLVAWRERADVLWGGNPNGRLWLRLHDALVDSQGWSAYNHPEWGYIKFGHTDPLKSNSGFMAILLMTYNYFDKTSGLAANDILSDTAYQQWFLGLEESISQFEQSTGPLMQKMVAYGPSTYDMVAVYEATAIEQAANAVGRYGELRIYYPPATVWSDHPFCTLQAKWVTPEKARAAQVFVDHLLTPKMQEMALLQYGFRPVEPSIPLSQPGSPFERYAANGLLSDLSALPVVETPDGNTLNTLLEFWARNVRR